MSTGNFFVVIILSTTIQLEEDICSQLHACGCFQLVLISAWQQCKTCHLCLLLACFCEVFDMHVVFVYAFVYLVCPDLQQYYQSCVLKPHFLCVPCAAHIVRWSPW